MASIIETPSNGQSPFACSNNWTMVRFIEFADDVISVSCKLGNVISNSITNASTLTLRANAGNAGSVAVSIGANSTGIFVDATDTGGSRTTPIQQQRQMP